MYDGRAREMALGPRHKQGVMYENDHQRIIYLFSSQKIYITKDFDRFDYILTTNFMNITRDALPIFGPLITKLVLNTTPIKGFQGLGSA